MAVVELNNVAKRYPGSGSKGAAANAVDDFNLTTRDGEFIVLVGPSGCGKSTMVRLQKASFQARISASRPVEASPGNASGRMTCTMV